MDNFGPKYDISLVNCKNASENKSHFKPKFDKK